MFKACVSETALTTEAANEYYNGRITGDNFKGDTTTVAMARAMLENRMPKGDSITIKFRAASYSKEYVTENSTSSVISRVLGNVNVSNPGQLIIYNLCNPLQESNLAVLSVFRAKFTETFQGYTFVEKISSYFQHALKNKPLELLVFTNETIKSTVILVDNLAYSKLHLIQGLFLMYFPWYYDREKEELTEKDRALMDSCKSKNEQAFIDAIAAFAAEHDFETERLKRLLTEFQSSYETKMLADKTREKDNLMNTFRDLDRRYADCVQRMRDVDIMLMGLEKSIETATANPEILEVFLNNPKSLILEGTSGSSMTFIVRDYASIWDEDEVDNLVNDMDSIAYRRTRNFTKKQAHKLLQAIFIDQDIRLRTCAAWTFDMSGTVDAIMGYMYPNSCHGYMPNPHQNKYGCISEHRRVIEAALIEHRYGDAIMQARASTKNLNFGDLTVMGELFNTLLRKDENNLVLELPDGRLVNSAQAVAWLYEQYPEPEEPAEAEEPVEETGDEDEEELAF